MEILSPVGNKNALISAVRSGADAVYFGVGEFNARRNAENFSVNDLKEISRYCHIRGVKAYLALNTLVLDEEIDDAMNIVKHACEAGIDGIIVNDAGLAELIRKAAPNMPLHASTQMTVHNVEGVKYLKEKGFKRVVLARENSLKDIEKIANYANKNNIELEIFVQGAHCMSVSGQCLLSAVLGCRSGNRGLCAQPCRLPFKVKNGNGYDLSLKDMNLYEYFDIFRDLGIASLKIEGRMKTQEYVAAATYCAYLYKNNLPEKEKSLLVLKDVFSRSGFTDGYLTQKVNKDMFGIRQEEDIEKSKQIKNSIHEIYRKERQNVGIFVKASFKNNEKSKICVSDGKNSVKIERFIPEIAQNKATTKDDIKEKLSKTGSTPYFIKEIDIELDNNLFVSGKILSDLKNKSLENLTELRSKITPIPYYFQKENKNFENIELIPEKFALIHDLSQIPDENCADIFFVPLSSDLEKIKKLVEKGYNIGIKTPVFFNELDESKLKALKEIGVDFAYMQNISAYRILRKIGFEIVGAPSLNIFNSYSLQHCPADYCALSVELSESQINAINSDKPKGLIIYGNLPLMIFRNCPIRVNNTCKNCNNIITDRKNINFPIFCEDNVSAMYNSVPLYVIDKPNLYKNKDFALFNFTLESKNTVEKILTENYNKKSACNTKFTRGLYFKGVL